MSSTEVQGSLSSTEVQGSLNGRQCRSFRKDPPRINPVIPAAGGSETVDVGIINYVAQRIGYDTEECIRIALEDGVIELHHRSLPDFREYDTYRLTAKGARMRDEHTREIFQLSAEMTRRIAEAKKRNNGSLWPATPATGRRPAPPAAAAAELATVR